MVRSALMVAVVLGLGGCAGLCPNGCYAPSSSYGASSSGSSSSSYGSTSSASSSSSEKSYVYTDKNGNTTYVFTKPNEKTIVNNQGVTVIQRERDGSRTVVSPSGVKLLPPRRW
jgi:hypothetical protein